MCKDSPDYSELASSNTETARMAGDAANRQQDFTERVYGEQAPRVQALFDEGLATSQQAREIARTQQERADTQWQQYQGNYAPIEQQMGLDALGGQYLSAAEREEMLGLTNTLGRDTHRTETGTEEYGPSGGLSDAERTRLQELQGLQQQSTAAPPAAQPQPGGGPPPGIDLERWDSERGNFPDFRWRQPPPAAAPAVAFGDDLRRELSALEARQATYRPGGSRQTTNRVLDQGTADAQRAAQSRITQLQQTAEQNAIGEERANAGRIRTSYNTRADEITADGQRFSDEMTGLGDVAARGALDDASAISGELGARGTAREGDINASARRFSDELGARGVAREQAITGSAERFSSELEAAGRSREGDINQSATAFSDRLNTRGTARRADATGFYGRESDRVLSEAEQRAQTDEQRAMTRANAAVANTYGQRERQLRRLGMDPNKTGTLATDHANAQALARVTAGNQVADEVSAQRRAAGDTARALRLTGEETGRGYQYADEDAGLGLLVAGSDAGRSARYGAEDAGRGLRVGAAGEGRDARFADEQAGMGLRAAGAESGRTARYTGEDVGLAVRSSALDRARQIRTAAATGGLQTRMGASDASRATRGAGEDSALSIENSAPARVRSTLAGQRAGAANFGRGYANTSAGQTQLALGAGSQAVGSLNTGVQGALPSAQFGASAYAPQMTAAQIRQSGATSLAGLRGQGEMHADSLNAGTWNQIIESAASVAGSMMSSDKNKKRDIKKVSDDDVLDGLEAARPGKSWKYKRGTPGVDSERENVGPMAQDMAREFPEVSNGKVIDVAGDMGLQHAAIVALHKKVKRLERRARKD